MIHITNKDAGRISFLAIMVLLAYMNYLLYGNILYIGIQLIIFFFIGLKMNVW